MSASDRICERTGLRSLSFTEAERAAKKVRRKYHRRVKPFRCPTCRGWHFGH